MLTHARTHARRTQNHDISPLDQRPEELKIIKRAEKTSPPMPKPQGTIQLFKNIIMIYLLTNIHEDWTINMASRVFTRQILTQHNARRTKDNNKSSPNAFFKTIRRSGVTSDIMVCNLQQQKEQCCLRWPKPTSLEGPL
ncbi:hypothetical protein DPMN_067084 [Dreissena polymorpha]|uniref:Uncharacterized protein n=1 Tax=Dreissena polymorpha TaxID=45954 RepID=A0A9D4BVK1_DREPO|nr:hypothetical protein DPMN_067084 [Dreissena polymorpha]